VSQVNGTLQTVVGTYPNLPFIHRSAQFDNTYSQRGC
jgi:hypothetical protein